MRFLDELLCQYMMTASFENSLCQIIFNQVSSQWEEINSYTVKHYTIG